MLAKFLYQFSDLFIGFNVFRYITVRAALAAITALFLALWVGPRIIRVLQKYQIGEEIRTDGPQSHLSKKGTPTMGGLIILASIVLSTLLWADLSNFYLLLILFATMTMGLVGFIDDFLKAILKLKRGLIGRYKIIGQISLGLLLGLVIYFHPFFKDLHSNTTVPFFKNMEFNFGIYYILVIIFVVTGASNAVNLTDGLDGLAAGLSGIAFMALAGIAYVSSNVNMSNYLNIIYLPGTEELAIFCLAVFGAAINCFV